jgi:hypothetical protein
MLPYYRDNTQQEQLRQNPEAQDRAAAMMWDDLPRAQQEQESRRSERAAHAIARQQQEEGQQSPGGERVPGQPDPPPFDRPPSRRGREVVGGVSGIEFPGGPEEAQKPGAAPPNRSPSRRARRDSRLAAFVTPPRLASPVASQQPEQERGRSRDPSTHDASSSRGSQLDDHFAQLQARREAHQARLVKERTPSPGPDQSHENEGP